MWRDTTDTACSASELATIVRTFAKQAPASAFWEGVAVVSELGSVSHAYSTDDMGEELQRLVRMNDLVCLWVLNQVVVCEHTDDTHPFDTYLGDFLNEVADLLDEFDGTDAIELSGENGTIPVSVQRGTLLHFSLDEVGSTNLASEEDYALLLAKWSEWSDFVERPVG